MKNTNMIKQSFDYFLDLSTDDQKASIVKVKAGGSYVKTRLLPFFTAFKYYKLGTVKINMVPASTLPVDPTGLSYEAGEQTADPRDLMNPGLVRITNGEDMCPDNANISQEAYTSLITDPRWYKFRLQTGFVRKAVPLYWEIGQLHQDVAPGHIRNIPGIDSGMDSHVIKWQDAMVQSQDGGYYNIGNYNVDNSDPRAFFQVGQKEKLGWMPTDMNQEFVFNTLDGRQVVGNIPGIAAIPEIELLTMILPKAYKTKFYYRLYITETVYFKAPVSNFTLFDEYRGTSFPMNTIDRSIHPAVYYKTMDGTTYNSVVNTTPIPNQGQGEIHRGDPPNENQEEQV